MTLYQFGRVTFINKAGQNPISSVSLLVVRPIVLPKKEGETNTKSAPKSCP
jgi:hypothetical protein